MHGLASLYPRQGQKQPDTRKQQQQQQQLVGTVTAKMAVLTEASGRYNQEPHKL